MNPLLRRESSETDTLRFIRSFVLIIFLVGLFGTSGELLLVGHVEELLQFVPLLLIAASLVVLGWCAAHRRPASMRAFQGLMVIFMVSGCAGLWLHYTANVEFELEMYPTLRGTALFWKAIKGTAPPTLAPGVMIQLGLLGLAYAYRHPSFGQGKVKISSGDGE